MSANREHLHLDDCPRTLEVLAALFARRLEDARAIGYEPTEHGAVVDWEGLLGSWLSSSEKATVRMLEGAAQAERSGGLPPAVRGSIRALVESITT